jgi:hypothetical protein
MKADFAVFSYIFFFLMIACKGKVVKKDFMKAFAVSRRFPLFHLNCECLCRSLAATKCTAAAPRTEILLIFSALQHTDIPIYKCLAKTEIIF